MSAYATITLDLRRSCPPPACAGEGPVARAGIEPATFHFSGGRSYRLSYLASSKGRSHSRGPGPCSDPDGT
jgi:hypothetical protein